ncbi:MAG: hypothetical protein IPP48_11610 [Chitinophagaceae bacterium]|nr:hypothetical protein [Chitinophagaceae bacterium]
MQKRNIHTFFFLVLTILFFNYSCTKLDTTDIGSDLIPAVDNVHTFADTLAVNATQGLFLDSTTISRTDDYVLGRINNDLLFGTTQANIYLQFKPSFFPYYFGNAGDTLNGFGAGLDSVVLCLNYKGFWGDSTIPQQLQVREVTGHGTWDSVYYSNKISYQPTVGGAVIGSASVDVRTFGTYMKYANGKDSSKNQIRIKLSPAFAATLYSRDTTVTGSFKSDSLFRILYNGLSVEANGTGNGLMYSNLVDTSTKLEIHYRRKNNGRLDTVYSSFKILNPSYSSNIRPSSVANYIQRSRAGYPVLSPTTTEIYLQATPGTYANLNIPGISAIPNSIIHRAELIVEQIPTNALMDKVFTAPGFLYLDIKDTSVVDKWKPIYFDLNPSVYYNPDNVNAFWPSDIDFLNYGGYRRDKVDNFGNAINFYNFNITRHVQQIVTKHTPNYNFRLYAPYEIYYPQYTTASYIAAPIPYNNNLAFGRVKVGSGTNPNYRMVLRIIYSKI